MPNNFYILSKFFFAQFVGHGLAVVHRNYLEVYPYERWTDKEIPDYESVLQFEPSSVDLHRGQTQPPPLLTEADLIALMDKHGIGTDATHAEHIETVRLECSDGFGPGPEPESPAARSGFSQPGSARARLFSARPITSGVLLVLLVLSVFSAFFVQRVIKTSFGWALNCFFVRIMISQL